MKKYIFIVFALACVLCGCSREEESLFDKSASERAQETLENGFKVLTEAEYGWEMLYFANTESRGYNILLRFMPNGQLIATAKNSLTTKNKILTDSNSTWAVKNDYGPIITLDTYNSVLHAWADPQDDGSGYEGDYEFLILHADSNYVKLKGKKHSGYSYLYPLKEEVKPEDYFANVESIQNRLFANQNLLIYKTSDGVERLLHYGNTGIFALTNAGEIVDEEDPNIFPFCENREGIQFCYGVDQIQECYFRLEENKLTNGSATIFTGPVGLYFTNYMRLENGGWNIDVEKNVNNSLQNAIDVVSDALKAAYPKNKKKAGVKGLRFKNVNDDITYVISYVGNSSKIDITFKFNVEVLESGIKLTYIEPATDAAANVLNSFPEMGELIRQAEGSFSITTTDALNPTLGMHMKDNSNSEKWYDMTGKIE